MSVERGQGPVGLRRPSERPTRTGVPPPAGPASRPPVRALATCGFDLGAHCTGESVRNGPFPTLASTAISLAGGGAKRVLEVVDSMSDGSVNGSVEPTRRVVEAAYRAFGARDIDALLELLSPDVTWGEPDNPHIPSAGTRHGLPGVIEWLQVGNQTEAIVALDPTRILVDGDTAAVIGHTKVIARSTGRSYATEFVHLVTVRDGKVVSFQEFFDTWVAAEAFRAE